MTYFANIKTIDALKTAYRALAMQHHPDRGGDTATMQTINAEYDARHAQLMRDGEETGAQFRRSFYEEQGWTGANYRRDLDMDALAKIFRAYVKGHYPDCKFSITRPHYSSFHINLIEAPFSPWADFYGPEVQREIEIKKLQHVGYSVSNPAESGYHGVNHHNVDSDFLLSAEAKEMLKDICKFVQSYNYDHSDTMTDYFDSNFYLNVSIGKYDKPFAVNTARTKRSRSRTVKAA